MPSQRTASSSAPRPRGTATGTPGTARFTPHEPRLLPPVRNGAQDAARAGHRARARPGRPARLRARRRPLPRGGLYDREIRELPTTARTVALTFNAAWDEQGLDTVLKVLRQQRASATSFLTGQFAERHPAAARAIAEAGHGIANHSYSPPVR
ncbi:polysaccharide deacetylase family protein [Streptomyces violascens]|uniref:polysaccharide deacetylase family protein n=1 Tax=Streptomyces violascens TaxID=67381 RepID=UPI0036C45F18